MQTKYVPTPNETAVLDVIEKAPKEGRSEQEIVAAIGKEFDSTLIKAALGNLVTMKRVIKLSTENYVLAK